VELQAEGEAMIHELKCWPEFFDALWNGRKTFEVRRNDRNYRVGDTLSLHEWVNDHKTGRVINAVVTGLWSLHLPGLPDGWVAMQLDNSMLREVQR
jgi:uncharacterized protein DUF3850